MKELTRDPEALTRLTYLLGTVRLYTPGITRWLTVGVGDTQAEALQAAERELRARVADVQRAYRELADPEIPT